MKKVFFFSCLCALLFSVAVAYAGQARTDDITIKSNVGDVNTMAEGKDSQALANIHTVDVRSGRTGDITIKGKAGNVTTSAVKGGRATTNVGSVRVGQ